MLAMRIERLAWDEWNLAHIRKHGVTAQEVEEILGHPFSREDTYKGREQLIGSIDTGRILSIVIGPVPGEDGSHYVFSARPASSRERRRYAQAMGEGST